MAVPLRQMSGYCWRSRPPRSAAPNAGTGVSCTQMHGGNAYNVIPNVLEIRGTVRVFDPTVRAGVEPQMRQIVAGLCASFGARAEITYNRDYPTLVNEATATSRAAAATADVFGPGHVDLNPPQTMIVEDFAFTLADRPGCYGWIGNGPDGDGRRLHSSRYDFSDEALPFGASYFARLVEGQ
jgi:metal-dependent amidase/aminoacylase/carboxypeptidase family protein